MAKDSSESSSKKKQENRVCEKIFRAVTSPVRTVRRISTRPSPEAEAEAVHVKYSETSAQAITKMEPRKMKMITRVDTTMKTDERFTDYIKKAKLKIRAMTNLGDVMETSSEDHVPISHVSREDSSDQFSDFIKKAKKKLKSSSTIARPNYDSFKK